MSMVQCFGDILLFSKVGNNLKPLSLSQYGSVRYRFLYLLFLLLSENLAKASSSKNRHLELTIFGQAAWSSNLEVRSQRNTANTSNLWPSKYTVSDLFIWFHFLNLCQCSDFSV
jgi:hypothetical protein